MNEDYVKCPYCLCGHFEGGWTTLPYGENVRVWVHCDMCGKMYKIVIDVKRVEPDFTEIQWIRQKLEEKGKDDHNQE